MQETAGVEAPSQSAAQAKPAADGAEVPEPDSDGQDGGLGEFGDFMSDLGATPVSADESVLAIKDATIDELRRNLLDLRSLGDHLAQTEKARLALESQLAEQRVEIAHRTEAHHAEVAKWHDECQRAEAGRGRAEERLRKVRAKFDKRNRIATERWHKIRALQQERKDLLAELKRLAADPKGPLPVEEPVEGPGKDAGSKGSLRELFEVDPSASADRTAPEPVEAPDSTRQQPAE